MGGSIVILLSFLRPLVSVMCFVLRPLISILCLVLARLRQWAEGSTRHSGQFGDCADRLTTHPSLPAVQREVFNCRYNRLAVAVFEPWMFEDDAEEDHSRAHHIVDE